MAEGEEKSGFNFGSIVPGIGHAIDAVGNIFGGLFNANQAKKNRAFQERMYEKQKADNIEFWKMQNEYNLPSAQLQRLKDAGLNPLLMYGEGGLSGNLAQNGISPATAPHGAQASGSFHTNFGQGLQQAMLLDAQIDNLRADSEQKRADAGVKGTQIDWYVTSKDIELALRQRNYEKLDYEIEKIASESHAIDNLTFGQLALLSKSVEMLDKRYELDKEMQEALIWYNIEDIAIRNRQVDATLKQIAVEWYEAATDRMDVVAKIQKMSAEIRKIEADESKTEAEKELLIRDIVKKEVDIEVKTITGTDNVNGLAGAALLVTGGNSKRAKTDSKEIRKRYENYKKKFATKHKN